MTGPATHHRSTRLLLGIAIAALLLLTVRPSEADAWPWRRRVAVHQRHYHTSNGYSTTTTVRAPYGTSIGVGVSLPTSAGGGDVIEIVNRHRIRFGLRPVVRVHLGAQAQAQQQHNSGSMHHSPFSGRENVAAGQSSAEQVVNDWMNSPGHRANILAGDATQIDVGQSGGFWTLRIR